MGCVTYTADLALAQRLADQAELIACHYLARPGTGVGPKADGSLVTDADREIERALRATVGRERPGNAFLGEELGAGGTAYARGGRRWIVDAIDGTASFVAGWPEWGTLIGLEEHGTVSVGVVSAPALNRRWWAARGAGAWTGPSVPDPAGPADPPRRLAISGATELRDASVGIWPPPSRLGEADRALAGRLASVAARTRPLLDWTVPEPSGAATPKPSTGSGTCHGGLLVAMGHLDAFLLLGAGPWDIAALVPVIEEAGGVVSDLSDRRRPGTRAALFSNGDLSRQVLELPEVRLRRVRSGA
jgi:histidinol-phosphatase